jgi:hypothetical protein
MSREHVSFDLAATGEDALIPALAGGDAFLALDLDGNGTIDSGAELFGNSTACPNDARRCVDGVAALAQHDLNGDGVIDAADPVFAQLRLWKDADRNGRTSANELRSLPSAQIRSISLTSRLDMAWADNRGNSVTRSLMFERSDGSDGVIQDVWFALDFDQMPADPRSSGVVSSLHRRHQGPSSQD